MTRREKSSLAVVALVTGFAASAAGARAQEPKPRDDNPFSTLDKRAGDLARQAKRGGQQGAATSDWIDRAMKELRLQPKPGRSPEEDLFAALNKADADYHRGHFATTGTFALDSVVAFELVAITKRYDCSPAFCYYDDSASKNAQWSARTYGPDGREPRGGIAPARNRFGTMMFGRTLAAELNGSARLPGPYDRNYLIHAVLAHELGHMVQFARRSQLSRPQQELVSDVLAGWSIRFEKRHNVRDLDERPVENRFFEMGDERVTDAVHHHGTKEERRAAFRAGFSMEDDRIDVVYPAAVAFVRRIKPEPPLTNEQHSPRLGIHFVPFPVGGGAFLLGLTRFPADDSPAGRRGLEAGDYIVAIDSKPPRGPADLESLRGKVTLTVVNVRTDKPLEAEIDLP